MNESIHTQDMPDNTTDLRKAWKNTSLRIDALEGTVEKTITALRQRNIDSSLQRLRRIFSRQILVCCFCVLFVPASTYPVSHGNTWLGIAMAAFFMLMAASIFRLRSRLDRVDCCHGNVIDSLKAVASVEIGLKRHTILGAMTGLPLLAWLFHSIGFDHLPSLAGGAVGLIIGLVIGLNIKRRIRRSLAELRMDLDSCA